MIGISDIFYSHMTKLSLSLLTLLALDIILLLERETFSFPLLGLFYLENLIGSVEEFSIMLSICPFFYPLRS